MICELRFTSLLLVARMVSSHCVICNLLSVYVCMFVLYWWRRGAVSRVSDLRSRGRGFESRPGTRRKNSGHVSHTYVPLFTKQYKLVPAKGQ